MQGFSEDGSYHYMYILWFWAQHCGAQSLVTNLMGVTLLLEYPTCLGKEEGPCLSHWEGRRRLSGAGQLLVGSERHEEMGKRDFK